VQAKAEAEDRGKPKSRTLSVAPAIDKRTAQADPSAATPVPPVTTEEARLKLIAMRKQSGKEREESAQAIRGWANFDTGVIEHTAGWASFEKGVIQRTAAQQKHEDESSASGAQPSGSGTATGASASAQAKGEAAIAKAQANVASALASVEKVRETLDNTFASASAPAASNVPMPPPKPRRSEAPPPGLDFPRDRGRPSQRSSAGMQDQMPRSSTPVSERSVSRRPTPPLVEADWEKRYWGEASRFQKPQDHKIPRSKDTKSMQM
jgi:hypothetical protein